MKTQTDKTWEQQSAEAPKVTKESSTGGTTTIVDNRPTTVYQRKLQETMTNSLRVQEHASLRTSMNAHATSKALPVQRKSPKGSSRFQQIAMAMGDKHGVDTSGLVATHNSSFPAKLNAEATIQGHKIHFAPGMDTHYNIRHEVAHAIDNTLNGIPKGNRVVNGQKIDTTREKVADRMANQSLERRLHTRHLGQVETPATGRPSQKEGSNGPVQRKIGFEFETDVPIESTDTQQDLPYGYEVYRSQSNLWKIVADNNSMEFVTEPFDETPLGRQNLQQVMQEIVGCATNIEANGLQNMHIGLLNSFNTGRLMPYNGKPIALASHFPAAPRQIMAAPQATLGVTLAKIPELIKLSLMTPLAHLTHLRQPVKAPEHITKTLENAGIQPDMMGKTVMSRGILRATNLAEAMHKVQQWFENYEGYANDPGDANGLLKAFGTHPNGIMEMTKNVRGLLALVVSYIIAGESQPGTFDYAKGLMALMHRTNLHTAYNTLAPHEQRFFSKGVIEEIMEWEEDESDLTRLIPEGYKDPVLQQGKIVSIVREGPTVEDWIDSIIQGTPQPEGLPNAPADLLSQGSGSPESANSTSIGAFPNMDTNMHEGGARNLLVLELRNIPDPQAIDEWTNTAMIIFDLYHQLRKPAVPRTYLPGKEPYLQEVERLMGY